MSDPSEKSASADRQSVPLAHALQPMRDAFSALSEAQRQSESALQQALTGIDLLLSAVGAAEHQPAEPVASPPASRPPTEPPPAQAAIPPPPDPEPEREAEPDPEPARAPAAGPPGDELVQLDEDPGRVVRARLLDIHRAMLEINRLTEAEAILKRLWALARERGLRCLILQTKGRILQAEAVEGYPSLEGASQNRIRKVQVPFDKDGVFAVVADERTVYSGPRPARGIPVDLVLVLGKKKPVWCLVIPFPYRNRWGRFLYVEADPEGMEGIFQLDAIARFAILQIHAARYHRHAPAEKTRAIKTLTLQEHQRKRARAKARAEESPEPAAVPPKKSDAPPPEGADEQDNALLQLLATKKATPGRKVDAAPERPPLLREAASVAVVEEDVEPMEPGDILARIGDLPAMPHVALKVLSMLNDPDATVASIQEAISSDQALSIRLLQIANSSLYGTMRDCSTISEAVMRLGFKSIRSWLLATATRTAFLEGSDDVELELLWRQSVVAAMGAQLLAERRHDLEPEVAFMGGLLQNIGLLLVARDHPAVFSELIHRSRQERRPIHELEREMMGFDHADLSAIVLQHWGLADDLVAAVAAHHRLDTAGSSRVFAAGIELGEALALAVTGDPANADRAFHEMDAARVLSLDPEAIGEVHDRLEAMTMDRRLLP